MQTNVLLQPALIAIAPSPILVVPAPIVVAATAPRHTLSTHVHQSQIMAAPRSTMTTAAATATTTTKEEQVSATTTASMTSAQSSSRNNQESTTTSRNDDSTTRHGETNEDSTSVAVAENIATTDTTTEAQQQQQQPAESMRLVFNIGSAEAKRRFFLKREHLRNIPRTSEYYGFATGGPSWYYNEDDLLNLAIQVHGEEAFKKRVAARESRRLKKRERQISNGEPVDDDEGIRKRQRKKTPQELAKLNAELFRSWRLIITKPVEV